MCDFPNVTKLFGDRVGICLRSSGPVLSPLYYPDYCNQMASDLLGKLLRYLLRHGFSLCLCYNYFIQLCILSLFKRNASVWSAVSAFFSYAFIYLFNHSFIQQLFIDFFGQCQPKSDHSIFGFCLFFVCLFLIICLFVLAALGLHYGIRDL